MSIISGLCNLHGIETFYDHPCFFFQMLIRSTIQDTRNGLRSVNFEVIFTSVGSAPRFSFVTTSFENNSLYMFWIQIFAALYTLIFRGWKIHCVKSVHIRSSSGSKSVILFCKKTQLYDQFLSIKFEKKKLP